MRLLSSYSIRLGLVVLLLLGLATAHVADYGNLVEPPTQQRKELTRTTADQAIEQYIKGYAFETYRNVFENSNFAVNPPPKPVKIVKAEPVPAGEPPPPSKIKPFSANLEVTGIAITPERKLVMIWDKQRNEAQILLEKEELYQWKVVSIEKHMVILEHESGELYEFLINSETLTNFNMQR